MFNFLKEKDTKIVDLGGDTLHTNHILHEYKKKKITKINDIH